MDHYRYGTLATVSMAALVLALSSGGLCAPAQAQSVELSGDNVPSTGPVPAWNVGGNLFVGFSSTGSMAIANGGVVNNDYGFLGLLAGASGTVTVSGAGARWTNDNTLYVGHSGSGSLTVDSGGAVRSNDATLGTFSGASGTATVSGTGSTWSNGDVLVVGLSGTGGLTIEDGGRVSNTVGYLGNNANSSGTATVRGAGSTWSSSDALVVGTGGTGSLTIASGGSVSNTYGYLGFDTGALGTATVSGAGSTWSNSGALLVGVLGTGSLTIASGGNVSNTFGYLGFITGSLGTATVSGAGSTWSNSGDFYVGLNGTGSLTIASGGSVSNTYGYLGNNANSSGTAAVSGAGSTWSNSGDLTVGRLGTGDLTINTGGSVSNTYGYLGSDPGSSGTVTVSGAGSTWNNSGNLYVGLSGTGDLTIADGGRVSTTYGYLGSEPGSSGTVTVSGAGSTWSNSGDLAVGPGGIGRLTITGGGRVSNAYGGILGYNIGTSGTATVRGAGSTWSNGAGLDIGYAGTGRLTIEDGGRVSNSFGVLGFGVLGLLGIEAGGSGTATVSGAGSAWSNSALLVVGNGGTGDLTIADGGAVTAATTLLGELASGQGTLTLSGSDGARGSLTTSQIVKGAGSATLTLDGGVLRASTDQASFLAGFAPSDVILGAGGAILDSAGHSIGFDAPLSGVGGLTKQGAGTLTLAGSHTYTGPTTLMAGGLVVNGSLASSVTVAGGTLAGTGTVGGLAAQSGGTVAPGNSIGTLNVAGDVSFRAGSVYRVEINAAGQSDRIAASGTATLSGGTVQVLAKPGAYRPRTSYTILTAGSLTGRFGPVFTNLAFLTPELTYDLGNVDLTLTRGRSFASVAHTPNQAAAGRASEALGFGNPVFDALVTLTADQARGAFDQLSGEVHASAVTVAYEEARLVRNAILTRLRQPFDSGQEATVSAAYAADRPAALAQPVPIPVPTLDPRRFALWSESFGSWDRLRTNGNAASMDASTGGFILGADALISPAARIGIAGGFTRTTFDVDARLSSGSNETTFGAIYGSAAWGAVTLRMGAAYAAHDIDTQRSVRFPGFSEAVTASSGGATAQAFGEVGYRVALARVQVEPFVGASLLRLRSDGFREDGGLAALTGFSQDHDLGTTTLGVRAEARLSDEVPLTLRGLLGWRHAYGDVNPKALLAFAGGASAFAVSGTPIDRDAVVAEAGLDWQATREISLGITYAGQIGSQAQDHALKGNFVWRF